MKRILRLVLWVLAATGCASHVAEVPTRVDIAETDVALTVSCDRCVIGESIILRVVNKGDRRLGTSPCSWRLWGRSEADWQIILGPDCSRIRIAPTYVDPGESVQVGVGFLPETLPDVSGYESFRFSVEVWPADVAGASVQVLTQPIMVVGPAQRSN